MTELSLVKPMKTPHEYEPDELIDMLRMAGPQLRSGYFRPDRDLADLINRSVGANTFRAFAHLALKPSEIFREWAHRHFTLRRIDGLRGKASQLQYARFLDAAV